MLSRTVLFLIAIVLLKTVVAFDALSNSNVAVYWGQTASGTQQRLSTYCTDAVDIVLLSFLTSFPDTIKLDLSTACSGTTCSQVAEDIQTCQDKGKKVLLSLGGAVGDYGFSSDTEAEEFASTLWNMFGGGAGSSRPFSDAKIDGFDMDLEKKDQTGTVAFGNKLRQLFDEDITKDYYLSAAPQCPYPDESVGDFLLGVDVDFAFIQFYNNNCSLDGTFNWDTWADFAENTSPNKDIKLFVGVPASSSSASYGYVSASTIESMVADIKSASYFGGISMWEATTAWSNTDDLGENFAQQMKDILDSDELGNLETTTSSLVSTKASTATTLAAAVANTVEQDTTLSKDIKTTSTTNEAQTSTPDSGAYVSSLYAESVYWNPELTDTASLESDQSELDIGNGLLNILTTYVHPSTLETVATTSTREHVVTYERSPANTDGA